MKKILLLIIFWACIGVLQAQEHFSAASFYPVPNSGREVLDFNPGWRFHRGDIPLKADPLQLDDSKWELVNLPHTVQLVPSEASGSRNYQGPAWYSKRFTVDTRYQGKRLSLYFEAVMGKSSFYINGYKLITVMTLLSRRGANSIRWIFVYLVASTVIVILSVPVTCM